MSCLENPHTFLSQRRDHSLIVGDSRIQGSFHFNTQLPKTVEKKRTDEKKRKRLPEDANDVNSGNKKRKQKTRRNSDEEQSGPSFQLAPASLKKGEKADVWASPIFKFQLPVTCGDLKGTLNKDRMTKGEKCILFQHQWFTPGEFEKCAGMESFRNWKLSIRCNGTTLGKLIQEGHLKPGRFEGGCKKAEKCMLPSDQIIPDEEETEQQQDTDHDSSIMVFKVICEDIRFESGTETSWMSDMEAPYQKDASWKKDKPEQQPLSVLIEKRKELIKDAEEEDHMGKKKKKKDEQRSRSVCADDEEQPGPSSLLIPSERKESKEICFSSPLKKGEKDSASAIFKSQLPVTCGDLKATLDKDKLANGEKCILFENLWFTPGEFEKRAGKGSFKNWKLSIRCHGSTLKKLIQEGHLKPGKFTNKKKARKSPFPSDQIIPDDEEEETEEETEQQQEADNDRRKMVFKVTCGAVAGTLHKKRFASGTCGKSIRTETSWMSPVEFAKEAWGLTDVSWKRDIMCEGKPLSVLIQENILRIHCVLCDCKLCQPDQEDLDSQKHDDECCVCKSDEGPDLVVCDHCPRSFHQKCHLPHVGDDTLGDNKQWMCTFCICRNFQQWRYGDELEIRAAMSQQISQHTLECQYLLLYLYSADEEQMFASKPNNRSKNYSTAVQTPMWFGKVADKLQKKIYHTVQEFVSDVQLIFTNCAAYSRGDAEFLARSSRLKELFDGELKKVFNISEQAVD